MNARSLRLLHLSYDPVENFVLRVPKNRLKGEDDKIKRICLAPTIEDAINAKPGGAISVKIAKDRGIPLLLYVYEAVIPRELLISPVEIFRTFNVKDAIHNQEYWATEVPQFQEKIFVMDNAVFYRHPLFSDLRVKSASVHLCGKAPAFSAQIWAQALNKVLSHPYSTDLLLTQLPWIEEQLQRGRLDVSALQESLPV